MRLSSSLSGMSKVESAALALGLGYPDRLELPLTWGSTLFVGVFALGGAADLEDLGVSDSRLSNPKLCCL